MTRRSLALVVILIVVALAIVVMIPTRREEAIAGAGLAAFLGAFIVLSESVGRGVLHGSVVDAVLHRPSPRAARPSDLEKLERSLGWRTYESAEFDVRVRPLLSDLIRHRGGSEADVEEILGHHERITTPDLDRMVGRIEALRKGAGG